MWKNATLIQLQHNKYLVCLSKALRGLAGRTTPSVTTNAIKRTTSTLAGHRLRHVTSFFRRDLHDRVRQQSQFLEEHSHCLDPEEQGEYPDADPDVHSPVWAWNEWDPLEEVIVGRVEGAAVPALNPEVKVHLTQ